MKLVTFVLFIAVAQFAVAADEDAAARKKLVGIWKGRVDNGATGHKLTITTDRVKATQNERRDLGVGTFKLDLTKKPWKMDGTRADGRRKGEIYLGIYSLEGDTLKWCVSTPGNKRPTEFVTKGSQFMLVLKRQEN